MKTTTKISNLFVFNLIFLFTLTIFLNTNIELYLTIGFFALILKVIINKNETSVLLSGYLGAFLITLVANENYIVYYTIFSIFFVGLFKKNNWVDLFNWSNTLFVMFFLWSILSGKNAIDTFLNTQGLIINFLSLAIILNNTLLIDKEVNYKKMFKEINFYNFAMMIFFFSTHLSLVELIDTQRALVYFNGNSELGIRSNTFSGFIGVFLIISIGHFKTSEKKVGKIFAVITVSLNLFLLIVLQTRGVFVAILIALIFLLLSNINLDKKYSLKTIALSLVSLLIIFIVFVINLSSILNSRIFTIASSDYSNGRFDIYQQALEFISLHPIVGNGLNQFGALRGSYMQEDPHNWVLYYLMSVGIVGFIFFMFYLFLMLFSSLRSKELIYLKASIIVMVIHGLFEPTLSTSLPFLLFVIFASVLQTFNKPYSSDNKDIERVV